MIGVPFYRLREDYSTHNGPSESGGRGRQPKFTAVRSSRTTLDLRCSATKSLLQFERDPADPKAKQPPAAYPVPIVESETRFDSFSTISSISLMALRRTVAPLALSWVHSPSISSMDDMTSVVIRITTEQVYN